MTYRGRPSKGCQMCRSRKVKCDEATPSCQRCLKGGHECVYKYKDVFELNHRPQTAQATQNAQEKWRKRAKGGSDSERSPGASSTSSSPESTASMEMVTFCSSPRMIQLEPNLEQLSFYRFQYDFIMPSDFGKQQPLRALPQYFFASDGKSCLRHAILATSYANFGGRVHSETAKREATVNYGRALKAIAADFNNAQKAQSNETVFAVYLLSLYEMLMSGTLDGTWNTHQEGSASLLRANSSQEVITPTRSRMNVFIYIQLLIKNLTTGQRPALYLPNATTVFPSGSPRIELTEMMYRAATVSAQLVAQHRAILAGQPFSYEDISESIAKATALDSEFVDWQLKLPNQWLYKIEPIARQGARPQWSFHLLNHPGAPEQMEVYEESIIGTGWGQWRSTRLHLQLATLTLALHTNEMLSAAGSPFVQPEFVTGLITSITQLIHDVCYSIPFMLNITPTGEGDPDTEDGIMSQRAYVLLWPFISMLKCFRSPIIRATNAYTRAPWIVAMLKFLRDNLGLAKAGAYLDNGNIWINARPWF